MEEGEHIEECDKMIADYAAQYDMATLCDMCDQNNIPNAPVNSVSEAVNNEQLIYRKMIREVEHPKFGKINVTRPQWLKCLRQIRMYITRLRI